MDKFEFFKRLFSFVKKGVHFFTPEIFVKCNQM